MQLSEQENPITNLLQQERPLPQDPKSERVVLWKVFRSENEAIEYSRHVLLEPDQKLVGGHATDTVGEFWWIGVQVDSLEAWGNSQAIQLTDPLDANDPKGQGRGLNT